MEERELSITWWNKLSFEEKWYKVVEFKHLVVGYPERNIDTLSGREIEDIWKEVIKL